MKRICALFLVLCMLITILPIQSFADDASSDESATSFSGQNGEETSEDNSAVNTAGTDDNGTSVPSEEINSESGDPLGVSVSSGGTAVSLTEGSGARMYLSDFTSSDMPRCKVGWGSYMRDRNIDNNGQVALHKTSAGVTDYFEKSVAAHASADLIYDLGENHSFDTFHSWVGVDASKGSNGDGVTFAFYASNDITSWGEPLAWDRSGETFKGTSVAAEVTFNIKGYRYFRIVCNKGSTDSYDHSSLGDAMVYDSTVDYVAPQVSIPSPGAVTVSEDANQAGFASVVSNDSGNGTEMALLQYSLYTKCGYDNLYSFFTKTSRYKERVEAFNWLYNDFEALKEFMNGGIPNNGSYISALEVLSSVYAAHKEDLNDTTALYQPDSEHVNDTRGDLYRRMMLTTALVCAGGWSGWMSNAGLQDPVKRYEYFKENYIDTNDVTYGQSSMRCEIFENLGVDEMRWVIGNNISNAEIVWLNDYARAHPKGGNQTSYPIIYSPHHHISYRWYNYDKDEFYAAENETTYRTKYMLNEEYEQYGLTYGLTDGTKVQRLWMVFEDGAVCGNISRTGANLAACFGVPACEVGQPGHAAFLVMNANSSTGEMTWGIDNDISGWMYSTNSRRMPCDWGLNSDSWISGCRVSYILLSQAALNHLEDYSKAEEVMLMYDLCTTDEQREACARAAISYLPYHLDAWLKLVQLYCSESSGKSAADLETLAKELCSEETQLCYYPKPMVDLVQLIINRLKTMSSSAAMVLENASAALTAASEEDDKSALEQAVKEAEDKLYEIELSLADCQLTLNTALKRASATTDAEHKCAQPAVCRSNANYYLSDSSYNLAAFSFDGENKNQIVFSSDFTSVRFKICLNSEEDTLVWSDSISVYAENDVVSYDLTDRIGEITDTSDILIWLDGWSGDPNAESAFCIDIKAGSAVSGLDFNDNENRCLGSTESVEYHLEDETEWKALSSETVISGAHTVTVRKMANGTTLMGPESSFTTGSDNSDTRVYIPISRMSVAAYSSEETSKNDYAKYVIDGKTTTRWHTLWNKTDSAKYITLKTDVPAYFSGLDYTPVTGGGNGTIYSGVVEVSLDGNYWMTAANISGWQNNGNTKTLTFTPVYGQYVRIRVTDSCGGFVSARKFELFENVTLKDKQISGISLVSNPSKLEYIKGEMFDVTGAGAKVIYADGTHAMLPVALLAVDTPVLNTVSDRYRVRLSYGRYTTSVYVKVSEATNFVPTSICIVSVPDQTSLYTNEALNPAGMTVTATDGTTTVYLNETDYVLSGDTSTPASEEEPAVITVSYLGLTVTYTVVVKKCIDRLELVSVPAKDTYDLGDEFSEEGISVQAVYLAEDGVTVDSTRILDSSEYQLEGTDAFSERSGIRTIEVVLSDNSSVSTYFTVQVYPRFTYDGIMYSADEEGDTCSVASILTVPQSGFISIPETVSFGSTTYTVTGVGANALDNTSGVKAIALPGTVTGIAEHALDGGDSLSTLYLTAHNDFSNLVISENAVNSDVEIVFFASTDELTAALSRHLATTAPDLGVAVNNVQSKITSITATAPKVTAVPLGFDMEQMDWSGFMVSALLENGNCVPLDASACTRSEIDTSVAGTKTVAVKLVVDEREFTSYFEITVLESDLYFEVNPEGALYFTSEDEVQPLTVSAAASDSPELVYSWYRSSSGTKDPENDRIANASGTLYIPQESGFYYAGATVSGTEYTVYSLVAEIDIGNYAVIVGNKNSDGSFAWTKGYDSLSDALSSSATGNYVKLMRSITLPSTVTVGRNITLLGDGFTVTRGSSLTGSMFYLSGKSFTVDNVTLDGGANWHGTADQYSSDLLRYWVGTQCAGPIVKCSGASQLTLGPDAVLCNNYNASSDTKNTTGGALYAEGTSKIVINGAKILDNWSKLFGSAIYCRDNSSLTITGGEFKGNSGTGSGSGNYNTSVICVDNNATCSVSGGWFHHNAGAEKGGIFWVSNGKVSITGGTFENNLAVNGSTLYLYGAASVEIGGDFTMQDIYLCTGKSITVTDEINPGSVNIVTQTSTTGTDVVVIANGVETASVLQGLTINSSAPGMDADTGKLQTACTGEHTYVMEADGETKAKKTISAGTCAAPGLECEYCAVCGALIGTPTQTAIAHTYETVEAQAATCTGAGHEAGQRCTVCGHTEGCAEVKATGHIYVPDEEQSSASTCTVQGKNVYVCSVCHESYEEILDVISHEYKIIDGVSTCIYCGEKINDELPANNVQQTLSEVQAQNMDFPTSMSSDEAKAEIDKAVNNNAAVEGFQCTDISTSIQMSEAKNALQNASAAVTQSFNVTSVPEDGLSMFVKVTATEAGIETRNVSTVSTTAVTSMKFDVKPVISTIIETKISESESWNTLLLATVPNSAITAPITFRLPIDSSVPDTASVIVWHHPENGGEKEYFGTYKVQSIKDSAKVTHKYIELKSESFSTFSYELPEDVYDLEGLARSISLDESLSINYKVKVNGYTDPYMVFEFYDDSKGVYVQTRVSAWKQGTYTDSSNNNINCYVFTFEGVNPQRMMDTLKATLYASYGDETVSIAFSDYSIKQYLENMLSRLNSSEYDSTRTYYYELFSNLITYGKEAQIYQNYETDKLISDVFTGSVYMENTGSYDHSGETVTTIQSLDKADGGVSIKAATLILSGYVGVRIFFTLEEGVSLQDIKFNASFNGRSYEYDADDFTYDGQRYYFTITGIMATEYEKDITVTAYVKGNPAVTETVCENENSNAEADGAEIDSDITETDHENGSAEEAANSGTENNDEATGSSASDASSETGLSELNNASDNEFTADDVIHYNVYQYLKKYMNTIPLVKALFNYGYSACNLLNLNRS